MKILYSSAIASLLFFSILFFRELLKNKKDTLNKANKKELLGWLFGLFALFLFHNLLMVLTNGVWGPYWYGTYWSVFFIIFIARLLTLFPISSNKNWYLYLVFLILLNMGNVFIETNKVYKKYQFHPHEPMEIRKLFEGKILRFSGNYEPIFSGKDLQSYTYTLWNEKKKFSTITPRPAPKELAGIVFELADKKHFPQEEQP